MITYRPTTALDIAQVIDLYVKSTLGERRPVDDVARMEAMVANANLVVTAWDGAALVGIARCISDFAYVTYVADLAVDAAYQRQGIGTQLLREVRGLGGPKTTVLLIAAPKADEYYGHIGFRRQERTWRLNADDEL